VEPPAFGDAPPTVELLSHFFSSTVSPPAPPPPAPGPHASLLRTDPNPFEGALPSYSHYVHKG
jgi:hypothetical protein